MNILVIYNHDSSWVHDDIAILKKHFNVKTFFYKKDKKRKNLEQLIKISDVIYIWFASFHGVKASYLAKKYGKKIITVASGYSVANVKEFNYGLAVHFYTRWIPKYILKRTDVIIAVSESNKKEILNLIKNHHNIKVVYHGFDTDFFKADDSIQKKNMVITVGGLDRVSIKRKGIDKFLSIAHKCPNISFQVIGKIHDEMQSFIDKSPNNVNFTGFVTRNELLKYYQKAKVYAQFSFHEGFGCTVAEAMLCNCVPIVTNRGSLPEVVGESGYVIPYWDEKKAINAVRIALELPFDQNQDIREKTINRFSLTLREKKILEIVNGL